MSPVRHPATGIMAASLVALGLAGCPGPVDPPAPTTSKRPRASATPTQAPATATPTAPATATDPPASATPVGATPTPTPTPATGTPDPTASATLTPPPIGPPPSGRTLTLTGRVHDDAGAGVPNATITATSLDTRAAFTGSVQADAEGRYSLPGVPEGANVEVVAGKASFTTRKRVSAYIEGQENVTDFGTLADESGPGASFFLAARLEIDRLEPDAAMLAKGQLGFTLVLSHPLDATNQGRMLGALRVWPANEAAAPRGDSNKDDDEDLSKGPDTGAARPEPVIESDQSNDGYVVDYAIKDQSPFLAGAVRAGGAWNAEGTRLSFGFAAPLIRGAAKDARYQVGLVRSADAAKIEDTAGHPLGGNRNGDLGVLPTFPGNLLRNIFREDLPSVADDDRDGTITLAERWNSTHDTTRSFAVPKDSTAPKLIAVRVVKDVTGDFRIELQFDEPLAAYNGTRDGEAAKSLDGDDDRDGDVDLADFIRNYTFVLGDAVGATAAVEMDGWKSSSDLSVDPRGVTTFGGASETRGRELAFDVTAVAFRRRLDEASTGQVVLDVDEANPSVVRLTIKGRANWLDPAVKELRVRVVGVADPAGNGIGQTQATRDRLTVAL